jgi:membrane protease YdiL (CAAX protease family)
MKRHRTDALSLVFGLIFLVFVGLWAAGGSVHIGLPAVGWVIALALLVLGGIGLLGALRGKEGNGGRDGQYGS